MDKEELQERIERFKKYYSKHLECFSSDSCGKCPLNEGIEFGMFCDLYFSTIFGITGAVTCDARREKCKKLLKEKHINHVNKI